MASIGQALETPGAKANIAAQPTQYNPWGGIKYAQDANGDPSWVRAGKSGDFGLGGLETAFGTAPPTTSANTAILGQMGQRGATEALGAGSGAWGSFTDPSTGRMYTGLGSQGMTDYLLGSAADSPTVGAQFGAGYAPGQSPWDTTGRTADQMSSAALTRGFNPLEYAQDPTASVAGMQAQAAYLRQVAGGAPTAAQTQLRQGLNAAQAGQASLAAGVRGSQAASARRASQEAGLDIQNQGRGQMASQQAADQLSAQGQLQTLNQAIGTGLGQRQDLLAQGQAGDATAAMKNVQAIQDASRAQLANLATRNDLTAEQKQQAMQAILARAQADRMAATYALRARQTAANNQLGYVGTDIGGYQTGGQIADRVNMAHFEDSTQRGAASLGAIGAGAGMAIRGLSGGSTSPSTSNTTPGSDGLINPYGGT